MTTQEEILVNRVGCMAHVLIAFIRANPDRNSRMQISKRLNISYRSAGPAINNLIDLGIVSEIEVDRIGTQWNKILIVEPETNWRM